MSSQRTARARYDDPVSRVAALIANALIDFVSGLKGWSSPSSCWWIGALRGVVPLVAGSARRSAPRFYAPSAPSAVAWSSALALLGFVWGDNIADIVDRVVSCCPWSRSS